MDDIGFNQQVIINEFRGINTVGRIPPTLAGSEENILWFSFLKNP
jgi:hypothetical protein